MCWRTTGPDCMAGAGWQGRRSMQAGPGDCQLTGPTCRPSASVGTVCLNPTQERSEAGPARCWRLLPCLARTKSRGLIAWSSAIGSASRRNIRLAGRSLAACLFCRFPAAAERDQREPEYNDGSSRARSAATRVLADCHLLPPCLGSAGERSARHAYTTGATAIAFASLGSLNCVADWNETEWAESV